MVAIGNGLGIPNGLAIGRGAWFRSPRRPALTPRDGILSASCPGSAVQARPGPGQPSELPARVDRCGPVVRRRDRRVRPAPHSQCRGKPCRHVQWDRLSGFFDHTAIRTRQRRLLGWLTKPEHISLSEPQGISTHLGSRPQDRSHWKGACSLLITIGTRRGHAIGSSRGGFDSLGCADHFRRLVHDDRVPTWYILSEPGWYKTT